MHDYHIQYTDVKKDDHLPGYFAWLRFDLVKKLATTQAFKPYFERYAITGEGTVMVTVQRELARAAREIFGIAIARVEPGCAQPHLHLTTENSGAADRLPGSFAVDPAKDRITITGEDPSGVLYGLFSLLRTIGLGRSPDQAGTRESSRNELRMYHHWDMHKSGESLVLNTGTWAGRSIFFKNRRLVTDDMTQIRDYARMLASVHINALGLNNVNVPLPMMKLMSEEMLPAVAQIADVLREYGVRLFLCIHFSAPVVMGHLTTADPLDPRVRKWWADAVDTIYRYIPDFGGVIVKADSEGEPGPFTYGRDHVDGANMLAEAFRPHGGLVIWRCFVYDCHMDWRDRSQDRAKAALECFTPLDGKFADNVILQTKNGPFDFQPREPVSTIFSGIRRTNQAIEFQIVQEYTGRQTHICYLVPLLKEALDFDTHSRGPGSTVAKVVDGSLYGLPHGGVVGVANICDDEYWTSHPIAQANFYGFGRLTWDPELSSEQIAREWIALTFGTDSRVMETLLPFMLESRELYEGYTAPLGLGWMILPEVKYGPDVDGYEYSRWGTYNHADRDGIGVDRTLETGAGYVGQYNGPVCERYNHLETCPDELLLFFHHVPYTYVLHSGKTVIQHIYDTHFESVDRVIAFREEWRALEGLIDDHCFHLVDERLGMQIVDASDFRDVVNTYFHRMSGIGDAKGRNIYP
jgi:alpha-glucuronidase